MWVCVKNHELIVSSRVVSYVTPIGVLRRNAVGAINISTLRVLALARYDSFALLNFGAQVQLLAFCFREQSCRNSSANF